MGLMDKKIMELADTAERDNRKKEFEKVNDAWWDSLDDSEKEHAMYAVSKKIFQGSMLDQGSYRYTLYEVMGLSSSSYERGMDCGMFAIHNAVIKDNE